MAVTRDTTFPNIIRHPRFRGGQPIVKGTSIPVWCIVVQWQFYKNLERVRRAYPSLDIPKIQEALAFYEANREEIDRAIQENEEFANSPVPD